MNIKIETPTIELSGCHEIARYDEIGVEAWLDHRRTGFGGSDAAACMDADPFSSRFVKWAEKCGRVTPFEGNEATEMGTLMEPYIRSTILPDFLRQRMPETEIDVVDPWAMYRSNEHEFMLLNVDGFLQIRNGHELERNKTVGLEIKNHGPYRLKEYGGPDGDEVPDGYYWQAQHGMAVTGLDEWWHFALIGGQRRILRVIPRNQERIDELIEAERDLWDLVKLEDPLYAPLPGGRDADMDVLMELSSPQSDRVADLTDAEDLLNQYAEFAAEEKAAREAKEQTKQAIIQHLGQCRGGESPDYRVSFTRYERSTFNASRFKRDHPQLAEQYTDWTEAHRLSVRRRTQ